MKNKKMIRFFGVLTMAVLMSVSGFSQVSVVAPSAPENWFNLDHIQDEVPGVSTERAYEILKDRKAKPVVVAVIDSGVDIAHEDLRGSVWTNEDEVTGNGIDDDENGYVDDIHGWSFIGGPIEDVHYDNLEFTRIYKELKDRFEGKSEEEIEESEEEDFEQYQSMEKEYDKRVQEADDQFREMEQVMSVYEMADQAFKDELGEDYTVKDLQEFEPEVERLNDLKQFMLHIKMNGLEDQLKAGYEHFESSLKYSYNLEFNSRSKVGDDIENLGERFYGNNHITGPAAEHGTHVSGIIAAQRDNDLGMKGIADHAKIMVLRAVPMGDERDKDIANSIYYAVDNGAQIINMSFGKSYSPDKEFVDKAVQYAEERGVLIIHAAGNSSRDNDKSNNFPNPQFIETKESAKNWIEVGASSFGDESELAAPFSNYGRKSVDLFAPGMDIYSTVPGSEYRKNSGTSMAAPVVSGVAALVWSYFPELTMEEVREIITESYVDYRKVKVVRPGTQPMQGEEGEEPDMVKFKKLSKTGGVVNAYQAVKMAEEMSSEE